MVRNALRFFLRKNDTIICQSFFYYQSRFSDCLKDFFFSIFNFINPIKPFSIVRSKIEIVNFSIQEKNFLERTTFSTMIDYDKLPDFVVNIIDIHRKEIEAFLGKNFLTTKTKLYRTYNFDESFAKKDIYGNIWHQDSHDGNKLLNIFILTADVNENDGPFIYLTRELTKKNWIKLGERNSFSYVDEVNSDIDGQVKFTGKKGDYLIINTATCLHRASIPQSFRDMIQVTLYPNWRKKASRVIYK